jgi:hypothetical protein
VRIYQTIEDFNEQNGAQASPQGQFISPESDWGMRLGGHGLPGGNDGGWLLTHLRHNGDPDGYKPTWLIAYEIGKGFGKTGRIGLLRENWDGKTDREWRTKAQAEPGWKGGRHNEPGGEADIDVVDQMLPGPVLV